jgi:DnaJ-class molecular chaperone
MSHYETLGVDKTATQDEIKKAYRKLSKQYHPDMSTGDEAKFKQIAEAYDVLGDEQKRQTYDTRGSGADFFNSFGFDSRVNMSDIFDQMFGQNFGRQQSMSKGMDVNVEMHIDFNEALRGTSKRFSMNGHEINVNFKPGLKSGQKFRLHGKGQPHPYNSSLPPGDMIIIVNVKVDPRFILEGNNIWVEHTMPWYDVMLGKRVEINSPEGPIVITVPRGTTPGKNLRIKDKGYPIYGTEQRGDLMCRIYAIYPELNHDSFEYIDKVKNIQDGRDEIS